jgi:D-alanyl-D-alanine carboxypeptidase (penicillin-binding protein 5/6)
VLVFLWLACQSLAALPQSDPFPKVAASYLVEVDQKPTWQRQVHRRLAPASLTKLMLALLALEKGRLDSEVTVDAAIRHETGTRIGLVPGQVFRLRELVLASLIGSANDACRAIAEYLGPSQAEFVRQMNLRARELGMVDTHFDNACGHDSPAHYASAQDMALLANAWLGRADPMEWTAQEKVQIRSVDASVVFEIRSTNALIGRYPGAIGLKTGHTPSAGNCLIALARRGDHQVLLVMLRGSDRWWDSTDILDLAFAHAQSPP